MDKNLPIDSVATHHVCGFAQQNTKKKVLFYADYENICKHTKTYANTRKRGHETHEYACHSKPTQALMVVSIFKFETTLAKPPTKIHRMVCVWKHIKKGRWNLPGKRQSSICILYFIISSLCLLLCSLTPKWYM
eukprot:GHVR01160188.1.p1 GENE.GHVR01160188.1~~GHVR01160188.1.p1  ORF type:complete len:134 (-),score=7.52 GHVR01160188.1:338-739(-)